MIKFGYTIAYVADVPRALQFFEQAFGFQRQLISPEQDYAELSTGATTLAFADQRLAEQQFAAGLVPLSNPDKPVGMEIALVTDALHQTHADAIALGAEQLRAPEQKPWGQTVSYLRCPSGILIELCTAMDKA